MKIKVEWDLEVNGEADSASPPQIVDVPDEVYHSDDLDAVDDWLSDNYHFSTLGWEVASFPYLEEK